MRIKRITFALGLLILILCFTACTKALQVGDVAMLEFPGLKWNATPEEVKKNLGLTPSEYRHGEEPTEWETTEE